MTEKLLVKTSKTKKMNIVFKIEGALYINPTFIQYGKEFPTDLLEIMMQKDKAIRKYVPFKQPKKHELL